MSIRLKLKADEVRSILSDKLERARVRAAKYESFLETDNDPTIASKAGKYLNQVGKFEFILDHLVEEDVIIPEHELDTFLRDDRVSGY